MIMYRKPSMLLAALLVLALLSAMAPAALAEGSFKAVVSVDSMRVYAQTSPYSYLGSLSKGTEVTVKAYSGGVALISYNGKTGLAQVSDLARTTETSDTETTQGRAVVATQKTRIYKKPRTSSSYKTVEAGTSVLLLAVNGNCAKVSRDGKVGYMLYSHLGDPDSVTDTKTDATTDTTTESTEDVKTGNAPVVTTQSSRIYATAALEGDSISVGAGTKMTLLAIRGDCAMVEKSGPVEPGEAHGRFQDQDLEGQPLLLRQQRVHHLRVPDRRDGLQPRRRDGRDGEHQV